MSCSYRQTTLHTMKICVRTVAHSLHCPYRSRLTFHWSAPCEGFPRRMFVRNASCDVIRLPIDLIASTAACSSKSVFAYGLGCACFFPGKRGAVPNWWMLSLLPREPVMLLRSSRWAFSLSLLFACSLSFPFTHTLSPSSPSSLLSSTRTKRSVMASSNHVTPTNCSWWPISAMDEDGKITDGEECEEPAAEPKPFNKDRLVLYHWTQSFTSQKVKKKRAELENGGGSTSLCMTRCYSLELPLFVCCDQSVFASVHVCPAHIPPEYEYHPAAGQSSRLRRQRCSTGVSFLRQRVVCLINVLSLVTA